MNKTAKGDYLESGFLKLLKRELTKGKFFVSAECSKVFAKKGYYSKDREKNIVFDISIEVYLPGQNTYSMLILIECKNYNHPVPVDDVEEFFQKLQQISGANIKGILVSADSFQEGTLKFSKSKGIGLIRYYGSKGIKWELTRSPSALVSLGFAEAESRTARDGLTTQSHRTRYFDCYCYSGGKHTVSLRAFLLGLLLDNVEGDIRSELAKVIVPVDDNRAVVGYLEDSAIEAASLKVLKTIGYNGGGVSLLNICEELSEIYGLELAFESSGKSDGITLGKLTFNPLKIWIYKSDDHPERQRFTLAHELGHFFLKHSKFMSKESLEESDLDVEDPRELGIKDLMRMEWQANYFASCLLLPTQAFAADFFSIADSYGIKNRGFGALYVDDQPCNIQGFYSVTSALKAKYDVSRQVLRLRLKKLGLLIEASSFKSR